MMRRPWWRSRWWMPAFSLMLGAGILVAFSIGGRTGEGLGSFAVMAAVALLFAFGGRSETLSDLGGPGRDERWQLIDLRATALSGLAIMLALIGSWLYEIANGEDGSPYVQLVAVGGVAYVLAVMCCAGGRDPRAAGSRERADRRARPRGELVGGDGEDAPRGPGRRPHDLVTTEALIHHRPQWGRVAEGRNAADGEAGRAPDLVGARLADVVAPQRRAQPRRVEPAVAPDEGEHRVLAGHPHERLDDLPDLAADRPRGVLRRPRRGIELAHLDRPGDGEEAIDRGHGRRGYATPQAPRAGSAWSSSRVGAKRSPRVATRSSTAGASKRSPAASPESSVVSISAHVVGVETVGRGRARSE
jgi:hypothetical protein